jgi:hypothetical protein
MLLQQTMTQKEIHDYYLGEAITNYLSGFWILLLVGPPIIVMIVTFLGKKEQGEAYTGLKGLGCSGFTILCVCVFPVWFVALGIIIGIVRLIGLAFS